MSDSEIVVRLDDGADLDLESVDIGTAEGGSVVAFTIKGKFRGVDSESLRTFAEASVVPTEVHFNKEQQ